MSEAATAIVFAAPGVVELRRIRIPALGPEEVLVRSEVTGVSIGTDRWILQARYRGAADRFPFVYGYLRVGVVEAVGSGVIAVAPGDRVFAGLSGCRLDPADGLGDSGGAYTSHGVVHQSDLVPVPSGIPGDVAAVCGLAAVAEEGVRLSEVRKGDLVAVVGLGMIGQFAAQICRARGARVVATDLMPERIRMAAEVSADTAVEPHLLEEALAHEREQMGPGSWGPPGGLASRYESLRWNQAGGAADVVIDTTGSSRLFSRHLALLRRQGRLCLQGYFPDPIELDFHAAHLKRAAVICPGGMDLAGYREALDLVRQDRLHASPLISRRYRFDQAAEAFRLILDAPEQALGLVLTWQ